MMRRYGMISKTILKVIPLELSLPDCRKIYIATNAIGETTLSRFIRVTQAPYALKSTRVSVDEMKIATTLVDRAHS